MTEVLFGLDVTTSAAPNADPVGVALKAEGLGFDFVSASDHPSSDHPTLETWTLLAWIAAITTRIRVATRVLAVPNRPPPVLAKMAETLDRMSGGRLILGLGGGYSDEEFRAFGLRVPSPRAKVDGLEEAIRITHGLWAEPSFTFDGKHYRTDEAELEPKPSRRIPIWLGTFGPRALDLTGRLADGWIPSLELAPPERVPAMRERILRGAQQADRNPEDITLAYNMEIRVDERTDGPPHVVTGSPSAVAEQLVGFTRLGFSAMNFQPWGPGRDEQIERLATEVIPAVRDVIG
ncbi:MAG TPA: LLM class flavin-dependent oxidoreductase [Actinomycetota bacterium]|nr:LLM class flavin-dependent oxidoreductase [Actinomycetota bacterium]